MLGDLRGHVLWAHGNISIVGRTAARIGPGICRSKITDEDLAILDQDVPRCEISMPNVPIVQVVDCSGQTAKEEPHEHAFPRRQTFGLCEKGMEIRFGDWRHQDGDIFIIRVRTNILDDMAMRQFLQECELLHEIVLISPVGFGISCAMNAFASISLKTQSAPDLIDGSTTLSVLYACEFESKILDA